MGDGPRSRKSHVRALSVRRAMSGAIRLPYVPYTGFAAARGHPVAYGFCFAGLRATKNGGRPYAMGHSVYIYLAETASLNSPVQLRDSRSQSRHVNRAYDNGQF